MSSGSQVRQATLASSALPAEDSNRSRVTASSLIWPLVDFCTRETVPCVGCRELCLQFNLLVHPSTNAHSAEAGATARTTMVPENPPPSLGVSTDQTSTAEVAVLSDIPSFREPMLEQLVQSDGE